MTTGTDGAFAGMDPGAIFVDHTTASADIARHLHAIAAEKQVAFLDAPVSGGQAGAEKGQLTVMVGGDEAAFATAEPLMRHFGKAVTLMGPSGAGQLTKMVNQICIAGLVQALSEGIAFAEHAAGRRQGAGRDQQGRRQSWQMENRGSTMIEGKFDFGFAVDWNAQGPLHRPGRSPPKWGEGAGGGPGGSVLCPGAGEGWQAVGYVELGDAAAGLAVHFKPNQRS